QRHAGQSRRTLANRGRRQGLGRGNPAANFENVAGASGAMTTMACVSIYWWMRTLLIAVPLLALLALSVWFAAAAWTRLGGEPIPLYGYFAIVGGVVFSLLVGGGLMALVFYSSRHGYDDDAHRFDK